MGKRMFFILSRIYSNQPSPQCYIISIITVLSHAFSYCIIIIDKIFGGAKMKIRIATPEDASAIQSIYRYYVEHTAITFELEVPSVEEFQGRIKKTLERYPYLVAEEDRVIIGYAYAGIFYDRRAYDWSAEMSVYVQKGIHGKGVGTALYEKMEELLKKQHIVNLFACITHPNAESEAFHAARGYERKAHFEKCGYKMGQWWDIVWMQKVIAPHDEAPEPFRRFTGGF